MQGRFAQLMLLVGLPIAVLFMALSSTFFASQISDAQNANQNLTSCLTDWANKTAVRASVLTVLSTARTHELDALIRTIPVVSSGPVRPDSVIPVYRRESFRKALVAYLAASDAYNVALTTHPVPNAPKAVC
jgi:hypothetical protein